MEHRGLTGLLMKNRIMKTINEKHLEMLEVESRQRNSGLTEKELQDFSRLKKLLQILDSTEKEPLKKYLRSFRTK